MKVALECKNAGEARTFVAEAMGPIRRWGSGDRWVEAVDMPAGEWLAVFSTDNGGGRRCYQVKVGDNDVTVWRVVDAADCNLCDEYYDVLPARATTENLGNIDVYIAEVELADSGIARRTIEAGGMVVVPDTHGYATIRHEGVEVTWRDSGKALFDADNVEEALEIAKRWL